MVALIAVAFVLKLTEPSDDDLQGPFVSYARFGEQVDGRDLTWKADTAYLADRLTSPDWVGETDGVWLVIEGTIGSKLELTTPFASIRIGDKRYTASDRPGDAVLGDSVAPGLPQAGAFVFELPRSVLESADGRQAVARFATGWDIRLDSATDMVLDLGQLDHRSSATLPSPGMVTP
jgi:hypothetical protein